MTRLAINGGESVRNIPVPRWPVFEQDEIDAVEAVLRSGKVNQWTGNKVIQFQEAYKKSVGVDHAIALANGSLAIELALRAFNIGQGDEVIVAPRSFMASASSVNLVGATPVFADIDFNTQNICASTIKPLITSKTKAIIPVHLAGWPCEMNEIMALAEQHNILVIEDCAQAHGARLHGQSIGSFGHAAAFSFCQDKIMSTGGEGGMLLLKDEVVWKKAWSFKDHGKDYDTVFSKEHPPGYRFLHHSIGTNWRMTEMQAAIGIQQLEKLSGWIEMRRKNASFLAEALARFDAFNVPMPGNHSYHAYYRLGLSVDVNKLKEGWTRNKLIEAISAEGISCVVGSSLGIFLEKAYQGGDQVKPDCPTCVELGECSLAFLVHHTLDQEYLDQTISAVKKVMAHAAH